MGNAQKRIDETESSTWHRNTDATDYPTNTTTMFQQTMHSDWWQIVMQHCDRHAMFALARTNKAFQSTAHQSIAHKGRQDPIPVIDDALFRRVIAPSWTHTIARHMTFHLKFESFTSANFRKMLRSQEGHERLWFNLLNRVTHISGYLPTPIDYLGKLPRLRHLSCHVVLMTDDTALLCNKRQSDNTCLPPLETVKLCAMRSNKEWLHPFTDTLSRLNISGFRTIEFISALIQLVVVELRFFELFWDCDPVCASLSSLQQLTSIKISGAFNYDKYGVALFDALVQLPYLVDAEFHGYAVTFQSNDNQPPSDDLLVEWLPRSSIRRVSLSRSLTATQHLINKNNESITFKFDESP